jgi:hypothetical protein
MSDQRRGISWKMLIGGILALVVVTLACGFARRSEEGPAALLFGAWTLPPPTPQP